MPPTGIGLITSTPIDGGHTTSTPIDDNINHARLAWGGIGLVMSAPINDE